MLRLSDLVPDESGCPRIAFDGHDAVDCGLLWRHDGPCVPFTPGDYLLPPIAHPLDLLPVPMLQRSRCPMCRARVENVIVEYVTAFRGGEANWDRAVLETQIEVLPCGCVMRDVEPELAP